MRIERQEGGGAAGALGPRLGPFRARRMPRQCDPAVPGHAGSPSPRRAMHAVCAALPASASRPRSRRTPARTGPRPRRPATRAATVPSPGALLRSHADTRSSAPTAPHRRVRPSMMLASNSTAPSRFGRPPTPTLSTDRSSSTRRIPASIASSPGAPAASKRDRGRHPGARDGISEQDTARIHALCCTLRRAARDQRLQVANEVYAKRRVVRLFMRLQRRI